MEWYVTLALIFGSLLVLFATGLPIFACFMILNVGAIFLVVGVNGIGLFVNSVVDTASTDAFVAVPMFVLLGELLFRTGGVTRLFAGLDALVGAIRGRLYVISIAVAAFMGAISGSALASVAVLGRFVYPTMIERGCNQKLAIGTILSGATLDAIIPPSVVGIILATLAGISVGDFLIAGIGPGILLALSFALYAVIRCWIDPSLDSGQTEPGTAALVGAASESQASDRPQAAMRHLLVIIPLLAIIFLVLGLVILGIAQPTEAAACGIVGALGLSLLLRTFSFRMLGETLWGTAMTTSAVLIIIASSKLFSQILAFTGAATGLVTFSSGLDLPPWAFYAIMMLTVFVLCMFIDQIALLLIMVPIYAPLVEHLGFDPIWFWMMLLVNILFGGITPPLGYTLFVFKSVAPDVTLGELYAAVIPVIGVAFLAILIMTAFPVIVTFLPSLY